MTRRGGHWGAQSSNRSSTETAGFTPADSPFDRKTCRPRAISVTRCGSSSSSFSASRAVSVQRRCVSTSARGSRCTTKDGSIPFLLRPGGRGREEETPSRAIRSYGQQGPIGVTTLPDVAWYPSRLWIDTRRHRVRHDTVSPS